MRNKIISGIFLLFLFLGLSSKIVYADTQYDENTKIYLAAHKSEIDLWRHRLQEFKHLSDHDKTEILKRNEEFMRHTPEERRRIRRNWHTIKNMSSRQRADFMRKLKIWQGMTPEARKSHEKNK